MTIIKKDNKFPRNKLKMIEVWMEIHKEELEANWTILSRGEKFFKVEPLK